VQRLKSSAQFQAVMAGSSTVSRTAHFALHRTGLPELPAAGPESNGHQALFAVRDTYIGVLLPKRWAKRAVTRNAIRRQIYIVTAELTTPLTVAAHVVRLRATFDRKQFISATSPMLKKAVRAELQQLFDGVHEKVRS
jgi:ribonuclease P protein component